MTARNIGIILGGLVDAVRGRPNHGRLAASRRAFARGE
jgi:hypothetical protein